MKGSVAAFTLAVLLGAASPAAAQPSVAQFFRGKTINIVIGSPVGGGYDAYGRLVARHIGKHIPGNPTVVAQNIPGAGGNKAASFVALQAPKDGTTIGAIQPGSILHTLLYETPVPHDPSKFIMLGSMSSGVYLCLARADAPVKTFAETLNTEIMLGTSGEGATLREMPIVLINVVGAKLRLVHGYAGSREVLIAIERNEVHGMCGMGWSSIMMQAPGPIRDGSLRILAQEDLKGHPELNQKGVPRTIEFAKTAEDRQVMEIMYSQNQFGRPYVLAPGVPADRVAALRKAFMATAEDKAFLAEAEKFALELGPMSGDELQDVVAKLYALPEAVVARARQALIYKPPAR